MFDYWNMHITKRLKTLTKLCLHVKCY